MCDICNLMSEKQDKQQAYDSEILPMGTMLCLVAGLIGPINIQLAIDRGDINGIIWLSVIFGGTFLFGAGCMLGAPSKPDSSK